MEEFQIINLPNHHITVCALTPADTEPIWQEVRSIMSDFNSATKHNIALMANIAKEYKLHACVKHIETLCKIHVRKAFDDNDGWIQRLDMKGAWVNFQRKYEFNPPHIHDGYLVAVIYLQCPYLREDEIRINPDIPPDKNVSGSLNIQYIDVLGRLRSQLINTDRTFENKMIMFPAELTHSVYPFFSSDDYRITVSGNLYIGQ